MFLYNLIIYPLYTIIEAIFAVCEKLFNNQGLAVIGVSIGITMLCLPLYAVAEHWQEVERATQERFKPALDRIKRAFTGDERYMMTTTFYKQNHYSPIMSLRSSFGLLIQIPFFLAAYAYLSHLPNLHGEGFLFIRDMGVPDSLFKIGSFNINVLPIAMTLINCISGAIYSKGHGIREKIQIYGMAAIFLVVLYNSPSGLVLYWTFNNIFSMVKNIFYKLKNPLKTFWICVCTILVPLIFYVFFIFKTKTGYKLVFAFFAVCIYLIPLFLKAVKWVLDKPLLSFVKNSKIRTPIYLLSCLLLFILTGLMIPSSLISSSPIEFSGLGDNPNPLFYIRTLLMQAAGFFLFWPICVYFLFNKQVQAVLSCLLSFAAIASLVNAFIFMLNYGDVSATLTFLNSVDFKTLSPISFLNLFVLAVLLAVIIKTLPAFEGKVYRTILGITTFAMVAFSVINISTISSQYKKYAAAGNLNSAQIEPIFNLSKTKKNVIVLMLDRAENRYVEEMFKESPDFNESFSGFTLYKNTLSFNGHTMIGAPLLFGGYEYQPLEMNRRKDQLLYEKNNEALLLLPRIFTEQADFTAAITDPSWANYNTYADLSITEPYEKIDGYQTIGKYSTIWYKTHKENTGLNNTDALLRHNLFIFSIFRLSPIAVRELIYSKGRYWNSNDSVLSYTNIINNYAPLDFLPQLTSASEKDSGTYICMVNELTHSSSYMQAPDYTPQAKITNYGNSKYKDEEAYHTNMAAFKQVAQWFDYLKSQGVYDNTRIIIVSDHSRASIEEGVFDDNRKLDDEIAGKSYFGRGHFHPLLMVKDFGKSGNLTTDMTFMTNGDVPSIALEGLVANPVNPFTKKEIPLDTSKIKKDGLVITPNDVHQAWLMRDEYTFPIKKNQWWRVKDPIFESSSWTRENVE